VLEISVQKVPRTLPELVNRRSIRLQIEERTGVSARSTTSSLTCGSCTAFEDRMDRCEVGYLRTKSSMTACDLFTRHIIAPA
jgi:hypothetical protein